MKLVDIVTIVQFLLGAPIILFAIFMGLQIRKDVSKDLQGKWLAVISFMVFFFICCLLFAFMLLFSGPFSFEVLSGSVFLAGACFMYIIIKITRTTMRNKSMQDRELTMYAEKMAKSIANLKEINEELEQEIAQRRLPEEALRRSEEKFSSLVESTEDSIYLIDRNCRYLFINKKHLSRLGISEEGYAGRIQ
jgi:PAS domain-containing protein